jgi:hypothetical protein
MQMPKIVEINREWTISLSHFAADRVVKGQSLVCPFRAFYRAYKAYCKEWGFEAADPDYMILFLEAALDAKTIERRPKTAGGIGRIVTGAGLKP